MKIGGGIFFLFTFKLPFRIRIWMRQVHFHLLKMRTSTFFVRLFFRRKTKNEDSVWKSQLDGVMSFGRLLFRRRRFGRLFFVLFWFARRSLHQIFLSTLIWSNAIWSTVISSKAIWPIAIWSTVIPSVAFGHSFGFKSKGSPSKHKLNILKIQWA